MNEVFKEFLAQYGAEIIKTVLMAVLTAIAAGIKKVYEKYADTKTKKAIVIETVRYVEQIGKVFSSTEKFTTAVEKVKAQLNNIGIKYDDIGLKVMIEAAVNELFPHYDEISKAEVSE